MRHPAERPYPVHPRRWVVFLLVLPAACWLATPFVPDVLAGTEVEAEQVSDVERLNKERERVEEALQKAREDRGERRRALQEENVADRLLDAEAELLNSLVQDSLVPEGERIFNLEEGLRGLSQLRQARINELDRTEDATDQAEAAAEAASDRVNELQGRLDQIEQQLGAIPESQVQDPLNVAPQADSTFGIEEIIQ